MLHKLRPFADGILGLFVVLLVDILAFHQGLYFPFLRPESYSGRVEQSSRRLNALRAASPFRQVVVMSDSTGAHCMGEVILEDELQAAGWPLTVTNIALGGSSARSWYHLLLHEKVDHESTALVVLAAHPRGLFATEGKPDLKILKTRLGLGDLRTLPGSYTELETQLQVATQILFRATLFREDALEFVQDPGGRLAALAAARQANAARGGDGWRRENRSARSLASARLGANGKLDLAALDEWLRKSSQLAGRVEKLLQREKAGLEAAPPMVIEPAQAKLIRQAVRMLNRRGVAVVIAVTPEAPWPLPGHPIGALETLVRKLQGEGARVVFFHDTSMLDAVEKPQYFKDLLHVNEVGAGIYSRSFAAFLDAVLESSELKIEERRGVPRRQEQGQRDKSSDQQGSQQERQAVEEEE